MTGEVECYEVEMLGEKGIIPLWITKSVSPPLVSRDLLSSVIKSAPRPRGISLYLNLWNDGRQRGGPSRSDSQEETVEPDGMAEYD
jgi:hypothetical protein